MAGRAKRKSGKRSPRKSSGLPRPKGAGPLPVSVNCPFCSNRQTEVFSPFGTVASVAQYYCRDCRTVFEYVKWEGESG